MVGYAHSFPLPALIRAADAVAAVRGGYSNVGGGPRTPMRPYRDDNPLMPRLRVKGKLLAEIDAYVRD
jgi:TldD protein